MLKNRFQVRRELALVVLVGASAAAACGESTAGPGNGAAGSSGSAGASGWTFLPPGNDAGTSTGTGGASGSSGAAGKAGSAGSGGGIAPSEPTPFDCQGIKPTQPGITSFDAFMQDRWTGPSNVEGGVYIYPEPFVVKPGDFLRYTDSVATYSGIGVWFAGCIDASKLKGVRFSMGGNGGSTKSLQFYLIVNRNRDVDDVNSVGACIPDDPDNVWPSCRPPGVRLAITPEASTQTVLWSDFAGGLPADKTDGSDILALQWSFDWSEGEPSYAADLTIDNLEFIAADDTGMGGAGGAPDNMGGAPTVGGATGDGGANAP